MSITATPQNAEAGTQHSDSDDIAQGNPNLNAVVDAINNPVNTYSPA